MKFDRRADREAGRSVAFESHPEYSEGVVATNALMQLVRDRVAEAKSPAIYKAAITDAWESHAVGLVSRINAEKKQSGEHVVAMHNDEMVTLHTALGHYAARTQDEIMYAKGITSLDSSFARVVQGSVAGNMQAQLTNELDYMGIAIEQPDERRFGF